MREAASFQERASFQQQPQHEQQQEQQQQRREASLSRSRSRENAQDRRGEELLDGDNFRDRYEFAQWRRREWDPVERRASRWRGLLNVVKNWVYDYAVWVKELAGWARLWNNNISLEEIVIEGLDTRARPRDFTLAEADEEYECLYPLLEEGIREYGDPRA
jgi:hypothetical protein